MRSVQLTNPASFLYFGFLFPNGGMLLAFNPNPVSTAYWWLFFFSPLSYKKTQETLSQAGQKTSAALSNVGSVISRKLGDMR